MTLLTDVCVGCGSALGAITRHALGQAVAKVNRSPFPWGTWLINVSGTLLLGIFVDTFTVNHHAPALFSLLGTGFCGAFTTFSAMSAEVAQLWRTQFLTASVYLVSSLGVGIILAWLVLSWQ